MIVEIGKEDFRSIANLIEQIEKRDNTHISDGDISIFVKYEIVWRDSCEFIGIYDSDRKVVEIKTMEQDMEQE